MYDCTIVGLNVGVGDIVGIPDGFKVCVDVSIKSVNGFWIMLNKIHISLSKYKKI